MGDFPENAISPECSVSEARARIRPDRREVHLFHFSARTLRMLVASARFEVIEVRFDRGAAAVWGRRMVNGPAFLWSRLTGLNRGTGLEFIAREAGTPGMGVGG
jgi:hypothetical protein